MSSDSSLSSPKPNPNPNPQNPEPEKINPNKRISQNKEMNIPNWLDLPEEIWVLILSKVRTVEIIVNVEIVCKLFRKICKQPSIYNVIDMSLSHIHTNQINSMTLFAVDRSAGNLVDIYMEFVCDDDTLMGVVERSKNLKRLRIGHYTGISNWKLVEAVKMLPLLEEVELYFCGFYASTIEAVGHACPSLKSLNITDIWAKLDECNEEAKAISRSMPNLLNLKLIGNAMTNEGLEALLDGCPLLESLDLRTCFHIDLSEDLRKRCEQIKHFRQPNATLYSRQTCKCNASYSHTPIAGWCLLCNRETSGSSIYHPSGDDDLEYIDYDYVEEPEYHSIRGYENLNPEEPEYDYAHADILQPEPNESPSWNDLQEFVENYHADEDPEDYYEY